MAHGGGGPGIPGGSLHDPQGFHQGVGFTREAGDQVPQGPAFEAEYAARTKREASGESRPNVFVRLFRSLFHRT